MSKTESGKAEKSWTKRINKTNVEKAEKPGYYRDDSIKGFALKVTQTKTGLKKVYIVNAKIPGTQKNITITIGKHGDPWTAEKARDEAVKIKGELIEGIIRTQAKREELAEKEKLVELRKHEDITLQQVLQEYCSIRDDLKESTKAGYIKVVNRCLGDWLNKPVKDITPASVVDRYQELCNVDRSGLPDNNRRKTWDGRAQAAQAMRVLRALMNFAEERYELSGLNGNPVRKLGKLKKGWNKVVRRDSVIPPHQLKDWYKALDRITNPTVRDYLLLLVFTGLRKEEAATLLWRDVQLNGKPPTLTVVDTKNGTKHTIPLSSFVFELLKKRKKAAENEYVFPGRKGEGHIVEIRRQTRKMIDDLDHYFMCHDFRRTFASVAERVNLGEYTKKRLLNHKTTADVTHGYIHLSVDDLIVPMQEISDFFEVNMGLKKERKTLTKGNKVVSLGSQIHTKGMNYV